MNKTSFFWCLATAMLCGGQAMANDLVTLPEGLTAKQYELGCLVAGHPQHVQVAQDGSDFYIQGLCVSLPEAWIKGTIEGNTATFPSQQYVGDIEGADGQPMEIFFVATDDEMNEQPLSVVYRPEADTYEAYYQYVRFTDDTQSQTFGSMRDVFFLNGIRELVELPADAEVKQYHMEGKYTDMDKPFSSIVYVAFSASTGDVYFQGLSEHMPEAWLRGTFDEDGLVRLRNSQYMGEYQGSDQTYSIWMKGMDALDAVFTDATFAFDPENLTFSQSSQQWLSINASLTDLEWLTLLNSLELTPVEEEQDFFALVTPPAGFATESYTVSAMDYSFGIDWADALPEYEVELGFDGSDVYVKGLFGDIEDTWVKGTLSDGTVTFAQPQYVGLWYGMMDTWMMGVDASMSPVAVTMSYDPVANRFEQTDDTMIYFNDDPLAVSDMPLQVIGQVALQGEAHPTSLDTIEHTQQPTVLYDLFGRKVKEARSGLFIKR